MRFVDADYLIALGNEDGANGLVSVEDIKDAPTIFTTPVAVKAWMNKADLVEVVRCKDCKHSFMLQNRLHCESFADTDYLMLCENDYCSSGERKNDGT